MDPQKPGYFPGPRPEVVARQGASKERAAQRVCCWIVQNEMRVVLKQMSAGAVQRILDSVNSREIRA